MKCLLSGQCVTCSYGMRPKKDYLFPTLPEQPGATERSLTKLIDLTIVTITKYHSY